MCRSIDKILKGTNPGGVPFYQPTTFEFVINLETVKTLDLTVRPSVLTLGRRADRLKSREFSGTTQTN
jgi:ABC-type uncharacterized transport system substrate-binding protein